MKENGVRKRESMLVYSETMIEEIFYPDERVSCQTKIQIGKVVFL